MDNNNLSLLEICSNGCGFYGNPMFNNMCSKCFSETQRTTLLEEKASTLFEPKQENPPPTKPTVDELQPVIPVESLTTTLPSEITPEPSPKKIQLNPGRCFSCRAKVPLAKQTINKCRCTFIFCDGHKFPESHSCDVNIVKHDKDLLAKNNPKLHDRPRLGRSFARLD